MSTATLQVYPSNLYYHFQVFGLISEAEARDLQDREYPIAVYGFEGFTHNERPGWKPVTLWRCNRPASLD
jgi:hypothetical protein